jgi:ribosomal protein L14E/L6E/L27E
MEVGTIVVSLAGRDKGRKLVVVGTDGVGTAGVGKCAGDGISKCAAVLVADGKERRLSKPKRKNIKHVKATHEKIDIEALTDKALRRLFTGEEKNG